MTRDDAISLATRLARLRFPHARAVWLGGSAASGTMTATSDLDVTVLLPGGAAPFRESVVVRGQPIELFVHTEDSLQHFVEHDRRRRRPTMCRLVGSSVVLVDTDGSGRRLQRSCADLDRRGPGPLSRDEIDTARYAVTDLLDDLGDGGPEATVIAAALWRETAELLLAAHGRWSGSGKWLLREVHALDTDLGTTHGADLVAGLTAVACDDVIILRRSVDAVLAPLGGPLFDGYRRSGTVNLPEPRDRDDRDA